MIIKDKFFLLVFIDSNLWHFPWFAFTFSTGFSLHKMDFKATLTHRFKALSISCVLGLELTSDSCLEDFPLVDEEDLVCCESSPSSTLLVKS